LAWVSENTAKASDSGAKIDRKNVRLNQPIFFEFGKIKNPRFLGFFVSKRYFGIGRFKGTFLSQFLVVSVSG
jgi:hypothetical protein